MERLVQESFRAVVFPNSQSGDRIDPGRLNYQFEIFGYDFMIDEDFSVSLIEINTNPCLETTCPILSKIIPRMLDNAFKIAIDPVFPPADFNFKRGSKSIGTNLFKMVFDESLEHLHFTEPRQPQSCTFCA